MVFVYDTTIREEDIKYHTNKAIRNILHENIDVHSRRLSYEFPGDGVKCIYKLQSHCANITYFLTRADMIGCFNRSRIKEGNKQ